MIVLIVHPTSRIPLRAGIAPIPRTPDTEAAARGVMLAPAYRPALWAEASRGEMTVEGPLERAARRQVLDAPWDPSATPEEDAA